MKSKWTKYIMEYEYSILYLFNTFNKNIFSVNYQTNKSKTHVQQA